MNNSELSDLEALLFRVLPDPRGYAERIFRQLTDRLAAQPPGGEQTTVLAAYDADALEALVDRNLLLASALGACECWGQDPACPNCAGAGSAGWTQPDRLLYGEYVEPANKRMPAEEKSANSRVQDETPSRGEPQ